MSDNQEQEMEFADPAWQPRVTQEIKPEQVKPAPQPAWTPAPGIGAATQVDTSSQTSEEEGGYAQGYRAQTTQIPGQDAPFQRQQQQQFYPPPQQLGLASIPKWVWIVIIIVLLSGGGPLFSVGGVGHFIGIILGLFAVFLLWLMLSGRMRVSLGGESHPGETRMFTVGAQPTIVINNKAGSIRLHAGQEGQVTINSTRRGYVFFNQGPNANSHAQILYSQESAKNTVSARVSDWKIFGKNAIDFDVTVPQQANLELITKAGNLSVQGVTGEMQLKVDAGTINASQVTLEGKSRCKTDAGSITFVGAIDPTGDYKMSTDLGTIDVTLPPDASFHLDAKTDLGSVSTDFPITRSQTTKIDGPVGSGPSYPRLRLKTDVGSIHIHH